MSKYCRKCGKKLDESALRCVECGTEVIKNMDEQEKENNHNKQVYKKLTTAYVINNENVRKSTNKVAYIANGWAVRVRDRGILIAVLIIFVYFLMAAVSTADGGPFFSVFVIGLLYAFLTYSICNTVAFIIRMGAEIIQLLEDIKNKDKENNKL